MCNNITTFVLFFIFFVTSIQTEDVIIQLMSCILMLKLCIDSWCTVYDDDYYDD